MAQEKVRLGHWTVSVEINLTHACYCFTGLPNLLKLPEGTVQFQLFDKGNSITLNLPILREIWPNKKHGP